MNTIIGEIFAKEGKNEFYEVEKFDTVKNLYIDEKNESLHVMTATNELGFKQVSIKPCVYNCKELCKQLNKYFNELYGFAELLYFDDIANVSTDIEQTNFVYDVVKLTIDEANGILTIHSINLFGTYTKKEFFAKNAVTDAELAEVERITDGDLIAERKYGYICFDRKADCQDIHLKGIKSIKKIEGFRSVEVVFFDGKETVEIDY